MTCQFGYLTYALDRNPTGIGQYTCRLLAGLRAIGCAPLVLRSGGGISGKGVMPLPAAATLPGLLTLGQLEISWYVKKHNLGLVHDPTGTFPLSLVPSGKIVTLHDAFPFSIPYASTRLERIIYNLWLRRVLPLASAVITVSHHSKHDLLKYFSLIENRIFVIPEAANQYFCPMTEGEIASVLFKYKLARPYCLFVGSIEPRKNLPRLLEAFSQLHNDLPDLGLVVVGAWNWWKSTLISEKLHQLKLEKSVTFTGYVPGSDLPALYNAADLFIFPSLYEGFGLPVLEAMACGTPVVTSNISSLPEVAGDAAVLVEPTNVDEIASAMRSVLENQDLAADLRQRGLMRARQFNWERTARETVAVYESVLGEGLP